MEFEISLKIDYFAIAVSLNKFDNCMYLCFLVNFIF